MRIKNYCQWIGLIALVVFGCSRVPVKPGSLEDVKAPEWVMKGSGAFKSGQGKLLYGVGSASGIKNFSLLRSTADNRARNELAKVLQVYTASIMKDYMASTSAGQPGTSSEEQHVEQAVKTVVTQTLSGVEIIDHWEHPTKEEYFSLARLDVDGFGKIVDQIKDLDAKTRDFVRQNAERVHDELAKEEERRK